MKRTVAEKFVIAALFSGIGRLWKRAAPEQTTGSVVEISQRWLNGKAGSKVATTLAQWEPIISKASYLALGLRIPSETDRQRLEGDEGDLRPLLSLFSQVPVKDTNEKDENSIGFFPLHSLDTGYFYPSREQQASRQEYQQLWRQFEGEIRALGSDLTIDAALVLMEKYTASVPCLLAAGADPRKDLFSDISLFDHLKMTAAIASCLYVHCMEEADEDEGKAASLDPEGSPYLLIGGDFSGVQDFIYRISSKGALKTVRGRSFFLEILTQHVVAELLEATGLSRANILYAAGAQFSLLVPDTISGPAVKNEIERIGKELNTYLIQVHGGKLYLVLESQSFGNNGFVGSEEGWKKVRRKLGEQIGEKKRGKFKEFFQERNNSDNQKCRSCGCDTEGVAKEELERWGLYKEGKPLCRFCFLLIPKKPLDQYPGHATEPNPFSDSEQPQECLWCKSRQYKKVWIHVGGEIVAGCQHQLCLGQKRHGECQVCHQQTLLFPLPSADVLKRVAGESVDQDPVLACAFCRNLYHLGEHLPDLKCMRRSQQLPQAQPRMLFKIGKWYYDFPRTPDQLKERLSQDAEYAKGRGWLIKQPRDSALYQTARPVSPLFVGNYHPPQKENNQEEDKALDFSDFAKAATGSPLIGVLRMDIDNLGDLFTRRFLAKDFIPTRTAALSRLLTRFFTEFINALCGGSGMPPNEKIFHILPEARKSEMGEKRCVTVIYSGGDDLFVVGAWSEVIELAFDIQTAFRAYVCGHPDITISGGLTLHVSNFPLYQMAVLSEQAEKKAKKNPDAQKNSFAPFHRARSATSDKLPEAFSWEKAEKLRSLAQEMVDSLKQKPSETDGENRLQLEVPRSILSHLFEVVEMYEQEGKLYLPQLHYILAEKKIPQTLKNRLIDLETIKYLSSVLTWIDLLSRREA